MALAKFMRRLGEKLQGIFSAAAFAESGEIGSAGEMLREQGAQVPGRKRAMRPRVNRERLQRTTAG